MNCQNCSKSLNINNIVNTQCNHKFCKKCFFKKFKNTSFCKSCQKKNENDLINKIINSGEHHLWLL